MAKKIEAVIESCGECLYIEHTADIEGYPTLGRYCEHGDGRREFPSDYYGTHPIPDWCPLEDAEGEE